MAARLAEVHGRACPVVSSGPTGDWVVPQSDTDGVSDGARASSEPRGDGGPHASRRGCSTAAHECFVCAIHSHIPTKVSAAMNVVCARYVYERVPCNASVGQVTAKAPLYATVQPGPGVRVGGGRAGPAVGVDSAKLWRQLTPRAAE